MRLFSSHKCHGVKLACFDCEKQICPECLVTTVSGLLCKSCGAATAKVRPQSKSNAADLIKLEAYSVGVGAVALSALSLFSFCVT